MALDVAAFAWVSDRKAMSVATSSAGGVMPNRASARRLRFVTRWHAARFARDGPVGG